MKTLHRIFNNANLSTRLSVLVVSLLLATLFASQGILYFSAAHILGDQLRAATTSAANRLEAQLADHLNNVTARLYSMRLEPDFDEALLRYSNENTETAYAVTMSTLAPIIGIRRVTEPLISGVYLYTPNGGFSDGSVPLRRDLDFAASALYQQAAQSARSVVYAPPQTDRIFTGGRQVMPVMYRFTLTANGALHVLVANIDCGALSHYLQGLLPADGSCALLLDGAGAVVAGSPQARQLLEDPALQQALQTPTAPQAVPTGDRDAFPQGYIAAGSAVGSTSLRLIYLQSRCTAAIRLQALRRIFLPIDLALTVILLLISAGIGRSLTRPLRALIQCQDRTEPFDYPWHNEAGRLAESYNGMLTRIQNLLAEKEHYIERLLREKERVQAEQSAKRRAELCALQAQIDPHFLYNTLDSIRWKADAAGQEDIARMTTALANVFRIGLSRGRGIIPLAMEAQHVDSYLQIQKLRYGEKLQYAVAIPAELMQLNTLKLILQPLAENAIKHGLRAGETDGHMRIEGALCGDELVLRVVDDGPGIPPQKLARLQAELAAGRSAGSEGYGIFNVNERIRLYFGARYGLTLESEWGKGTAAILRLPADVKEESDEIPPVDC